MKHASWIHTVSQEAVDGVRSEKIAWVNGIVFLLSISGTFHFRSCCVDCLKLAHPYYRHPDYTASLHYGSPIVSQIAKMPGPNKAFFFLHHGR